MRSKMTISEFVAATDNVGDEEKKRVEAYHCHEALLATMRTCAKDTTTAENEVVKEKQVEVGGTIDYKWTFSSETTTLEKVEADEEPEEDKFPVCWMRGGGGPLRRQQHEAFARSRKTYSREIITSEKLVVEDRQGEKTYSLDITNINVLVGKRQKVKFCLGEVDEGKKFADVEVEEIETEVAEADAKEDSARNSSYTSKN